MINVQLIYPDWERLNRDERFDVMSGQLTLDPDDPRCEVVHSYRVVSAKHQPLICERLFEQFNIGDRAGLRVRSMSVGDMVRFHDQFTDERATYVCASFGFTRIDSN